MRVILIALALALMPAPRIGAAESSAEPQAPALASDTERQTFCKDAAAHRLPSLIADAASTVLGHGFHFDSYQAVPAASAADPKAATAVAITYRIQVMDEQNQALEIRVPASPSGQPTAEVTQQWMCWMPTTAATARREATAVEPKP